MSAPFWIGLILVILFFITLGLLFIFSCDPEGRGSEYRTGTMIAMSALVILFVADLLWALLRSPA